LLRGSCSPCWAARAVRLTGDGSFDPASASNTVRAHLGVRRCRSPARCRVRRWSSFYRAGDGNDESFTAQVIVSDGDLADDISGVQNLWVQGVGCGTAIVNFN
jgi:hypothetical protein